MRLSAAEEFEAVNEFVKDIDLLGFSRCAQDGEKNANDKDTASKPKNEVMVSNVRLDICDILLQIRTDIRPDLINVFEVFLFKSSLTRDQCQSNV